MDESCTGRWCFLKPLLEGANPLYFEITIYIILFVIFVAIFGSITDKLSQKWQDRIYGFLGIILALAAGIALVALLAYLLFVIITSLFQGAIETDWADLLWSGFYYLMIGSFVMIFSALIFGYFSWLDKLFKEDTHLTKSEEIFKAVVFIVSLILLGFIAVETLN